MKFELKGNTAKVINTLFQTLLVSYLVLILLEQVWKGVASNYLNLNYLLIIVIILGILDVFSIKEKRPFSKPTKYDYSFVALLGILGFIIIRIKTAQLDWLSWVISIIAGVLIILLSILILEDKDE